MAGHIPTAGASSMSWCCESGKSLLYFSKQMGDPQRILIVQPSWIGDCVMASPTLRAIRESFPDANISYLMRRYVKPIYSGMPWADKFITYRTGKPKAKAG